MQIPALFLPKHPTKYKRKVEPVYKSKEVDNKNFSKKLPVLLQGRIDGNKKNIGKVRSGR